MPKVSVIIPIYNVEKYLAHCLDSVLAQTFRDFEVICVNDGSTDNSGKILEEYAQKDERIKIINQKNLGQSVARNVGINQALGDYLFFVDSDDELHFQAIEVLLTVAEKTASLITVSESFLKLSKKQSFTNTYNVSSIDYVIHAHPVEDMLNERYLSSVVWNKLFRKEVFRQHRFIEGIKFEDWPLITCLFSEIPFYVSVNIPLYLYNDVRESTTRSIFSVKKMNDYIIGITFVYNYYQQYQKQKYWRIVQRKRIKQSIKIVLSKINSATQYKNELIDAFFEKFQELRAKKIFLIRDLSLKSKYRLLKLYLLKEKK